MHGLAGWVDDMKKLVEICGRDFFEADLLKKKQHLSLQNEYLLALLPETAEEERFEVARMYGQILNF